MANYKKTIDTNDDMLRTPTPVHISEIGTYSPIEVVAETHLIKDVVELEKFMNETVVIIMHETAAEGSLQVECPGLNGRNQPIVRGVKTPIKRKFLEVLAQSNAFKYRQSTNPVDISDITFIPRRTQGFPFSVIEDPNPKGREWLEGVLAAD